MQCTWANYKEPKHELHTHERIHTHKEANKRRQLRNFQGHSVTYLDHHLSPLSDTCKRQIPQLSE